MASKARDLSRRGHRAMASAMTEDSITKAHVGLGNVDNTSDATQQAAVLSAATSSDVGLGNVENTALSTWQGTTNIEYIGTHAVVASSLRTTGWHIYGNQWYNHGSGGGSNIYLRTPITHNESNMFCIEILSYEYGGSYVGSYLFSGYAYSGSSLISARYHTISGRGLGMGVNSQNKIYCQISSGAHYYAHYTYRYHGWGQKNDTDFTWHNSAG